MPECAPLCGELEIGDEPPIALYRFYDADGVLLYVGITANLKRPLADYTGRSWWKQVTRKTVMLYPTSASAQEAEIAAIRDEAPSENIARGGGSLERTRLPRRSVTDLTGDVADAFAVGEWIILRSMHMRRRTAANAHEMDCG
jgi:hypothetical protein